MRLRRRAALLGIAALAAAGTALGSPAAAHPLGDPQTLRLAAAGERVTARWTAPPDDLLVLGSLTGAIPDRREYVFDLNPDAEPEPVGQTDADLLQASPDVADYLAEHVRVSQGGRRCPAAVDVSALIEDGAELVFTCPSPVVEVELEVTVLTDADPAYRTVAFAEGADPEQHLFSADEPVMQWRFDGASASESNWPTAAALIAALAVVAAAAITVLRRLRRAADGGRP